MEGWRVAPLSPGIPQDLTKNEGLGAYILLNAQTPRNRQKMGERGQFNKLSPKLRDRIARGDHSLILIIVLSLRRRISFLEETRRSI